MQDKKLHTAIAYCFLIIGVLLFISGCWTKKSSTDFKQTEVENVSFVDNSTLRKKETVTETNQETKLKRLKINHFLKMDADKI